MVGEHFAQPGAGDIQPVFLAMRAGPAGRHAAAFAAKERDVDLQRLGRQAAFGQRVEDMMRVERAVIVANPGMVAPDDQMGATEILPARSRRRAAGILR